MATNFHKNTIHFPIMIIVLFSLLLFFLFILRNNSQFTTVSTSVASIEDNTLYLYGQLSPQKNRQDAISWWRSDNDGFYYFFLPAEAKDADIHIAFHFPDTDTIVWGASTYKSGDIIAELCEGAIAVTIADTAYPVKVIYSDPIPTFMIHTESSSMDSIDSHLGLSESGTILVTDSASSYYYDGELSYIKGRGNSSFGYDKKSYQIRFPEKTGLCGMDKAKKWVLIPQYFDHTSLRNGLTFELAKELNLGFTPNYRYINLYLNGNYHGLYLVTDKIEVSQSRVNIRNLDEFFHPTADMDPNDLPTFGEKEYVLNSSKGYQLDCTPDDITGGYLLELELAERYSLAGDCGFVTSHGQAVIIKSPEFATEEEVSYIQNWYQEFEDALYSPDGFNPSARKHYSEYLDIKSAAAKYLLEEWIKNPDAGKTSQYFYKPADSSSSLMYAGPVWDYDIAYGALVAFAHPEGLWASYLDEDCNIYTALCAQPDFMEEVLRQYQELLLPFYQTSVQNYLDTVPDTIRKASYMSSIRWNSYDTTDYDSFLNKYDKDVAGINQFLTARTDYLNAIWLENQKSHDVYLDVSDCDYFYLGTDNHVSVLDNECIYFLYDPVKYGYTFDHWQNKNTGEVFDLSTPVTQDDLILEPVFTAE